MKNIPITNQFIKSTVQNLILFIAIVTFATGCQKEDLTPVPSNPAELKTVDVAGYNKVRNSIARSAEYETYCGTDYFYTESIFINGVEWEYPSSGYEYLMYKGLSHFA